MGNVTPINPDPWDDTPDGIQPLALIPAGDYRVAYVRHEYIKAFGDHKAKVVCEIVQGEFAGITLERFYNVKFDSKCYRPPKSAHCHYRRDMKATTGSATARLSSLRGLALTATVLTITRDAQGDLIPEHQYSLISSLRKA